MPATNEQKLKYIAKLVAECKNCNLYKNALNHVPGFGNPNAEIVFIGEAPGATEDKLGLPFVGNSGKLLDKLLNSINVPRSDVFICNILKHRPPENRDPLPAEIIYCTPFLKAQLLVIKPKIIITLGRFAMNYFFPDDRISSVHGQIKKIIWKEIPLTIIPVYHPSAGLRNGAMLKSLQQDFLNIGKFLGKI
ncbi:MAG TPA: uracil-DNA glycosylase [Candidatus Woesebacteria bacterium]|nr:uracil-DNA glycosylase [Candidatus Woesebacteria bacterium]HPJ16776.1 uracil-DNA glycosylase [Candidatus Woesebacteria bacterium]